MQYTDTDRHKIDTLQCTIILTTPAQQDRHAPMFPLGYATDSSVQESRAAARKPRDATSVLFR